MDNLIGRFTRVDLDRLQGLAHRQRGGRGTRLSRPFSSLVSARAGPPVDGRRHDVAMTVEWATHDTAWRPVDVARCDHRRGIVADWRVDGAPGALVITASCDLAGARRRSGLVEARLG